MNVAALAGRGFDRRALRTGVLAALLLVLAYSLIIVLSSRSLEHLTAQWRGDALFIALVAAGFGAQMGLYAHVRRLMRGDGRAAAVATGGTVASTTAMVACCLHHLNDLVPFLGLSGAATFLIAYRIPVVLLSLGANAVGIALMLRALRRLRGLAMSAPAAAPACR